MKAVRPGDWLVIAAGLLATAATAAAQWGRGAPAMAQVRLDGRIVAELPLTGTHRIALDGALAARGQTVIEVEPGRARIAADPGPRQYCVQQGWLTRAGSVAVCAPSHISLQLVGPDGAHDTVAF
ncbi:NusG domain II-containing protein [Methyloversatilis sp.]|uniref:NusG domain II-containing protein n=1 Tax=Methyloversatilis sp. TaxID=2569862 RepID=UPI002736D799|nr:NusG domain II-containing protein [Methyloversatilis sp.]MDP3456435.1 NusG domain II-containing protein [Methyloversatilis sp.]MDP3576709.1 NusG domain II-containing protein [Methyloversatilis sp.]